MTAPALAVSVQNLKIRYVLRCCYSDLPIGDLELLATAGTLPYLSHWTQMINKHPVFTMPSARLLKFTSDEWQRLGKKAADEDITESESNILRVCFLALLHDLGSIKQDQPALPPLHVVQSQLNRLMNLCYYKSFIESKKFGFPTYHLCQGNSNLDFRDLHVYLDTCIEVMNNYSTQVTEKVEIERVRAAEAALKALNREWVTPPSKKILWRWVVANMPSKYSPDCEGWLSTLFLGGSAAIIDFDKEDIDLMEEMIVSECPAGTSIMSAVRGRIQTIRKIWEQHREQFSIDLADYHENHGVLVNGQPVHVENPGQEPSMSQFASKAQYFVAHAKWTIAMAAWKKQEEGLTVVKPINKQLEAL